MKKLEFTIQLEPKTKKNSSRIVRIGGHYALIPSKAYVQYEKDMGIYLPKLKSPIGYPVNVKAVYYRSTMRRCDLTNLHEALHDALVKYGVLKDDCFSIVRSTDGSRVLVDREHPRTEVTIERI